MTSTIIGSRYVSWLPSFSVEVTHTQLLPQGGVRQPALQTSQLDNMVTLKYIHLSVETLRL